MESLKQVVEMLISVNPDLYEIIFLSLRVSFTAVALGILFGIPLGAFLSFKDFRGKQLAVNVLYTFMGLPPVLAGLFVYFLVTRHGPLGKWQLLFTPRAMIMAQFLLVFPIIAGLSMVAINSKAERYVATAISLGANSQQVAWTVIKEARLGIMAAIITAFGRAIAEVGAVMLVGGNIEHSTRVMTTAIMMETRKGNYTLALALGLVLLTISFITNSLLNYFQREVRT
jgi:tungstate transport system permease protein